MKSAEFMLMITAIDILDHHQRKLPSTALNQLSDEPKVFELIESCFEARDACPHCTSVELYRHGLVNGLQRYKCKSCHKTFNALTGTPLARLSNKPKWINYLVAMSQSLTVRQSASDTDVHRNTSFRWGHRFLEWITQDRTSNLHYIAEADETYLLESEKASVT